MLTSGLQILFETLIYFNRKCTYHLAVEIMKAIDFLKRLFSKKTSLDSKKASRQPKWVMYDFQRVG